VSPPSGRRVLVTGGAGFIGSHLCERLVESGSAVVCLDNLVTGSVRNIAHLFGRPDFELVEADVCDLTEIGGALDAVLHFASLASPAEYLAKPLETLAVGSAGTQRCLELAERKQARIVLASTSEIYGDPDQHPQREGYWGNVNPIGPRSVYDEAKRFSEALTMAYRRARGVDVGIVRIFNTYGPRMKANDGRVVSNFVVQALRGEPLTIYGDGSQTRSFCYVDDLVRGVLAMLDSTVVGPVNLGNPGEFTVRELADVVREVTGSSSEVVFEPLPTDDPTRRCPDITLAGEQLHWKPEIDLRSGLERITTWFRSEGVGG
jgi:dTDP-glucose 4,6-dehydratase